MVSHNDIAWTRRDGCDRRDENIFFEWGQESGFLLHGQNSEIRAAFDLWSGRVREWRWHAVDASYVYLCPSGYVTLFPLRITSVADERENLNVSLLGVS